MEEFGDYIKERQIGFGGYANVYLGHKKDDCSIQVAIKLFKQIKLLEENENHPVVSQIKKEWWFLSELDKLKQLGCQIPELQYLNKLLAGYRLFNQDYCFYILILEFARNGKDSLLSIGNLCEFLCNNPWLPEVIAASYNEQIAKAVKIMHMLNVAHLDIKPDNMLLDDNFILKLADFGCLSINPQQNENIGTKGYKAPEVHREDIYQPKQADIFSLGCSFVAIRAGVHPFRDVQMSISQIQPDMNQTIFRNLIDSPELFWEQVAEFSKEENNISITFEADFKDLVERMLHYVPAKRPSIEQVLSHPYFTKSQKIEQKDLIQYMRSQYLTKYLSQIIRQLFTPTNALSQFNNSPMELEQMIEIEQTNLNVFTFRNYQQLPAKKFKQSVERFADKIIIKTTDLIFSEITEDLQTFSLHRLITNIDKNCFVGFLLEESNTELILTLIDICGDRNSQMKIKKYIKQQLRNSIEENQQVQQII